MWTSAASTRTLLNGEVVQEGPLAEMNFPIDYLLADLCRHMTFLPGDVVLTGTPANSRPMEPGDVVEVEVDGLGRLTNTVAERPAPAHGVGHQPTDGDAVARVALGGDWLAARDRAQRPPVGSQVTGSGSPVARRGPVRLGKTAAMADLETLLAHHEITQVIYRYARGIDRLDFDLVRSCYHPDAYDDHGTMKGDVDTFIEGCRRFLPRFEATQHFMGNLLIEVDGDRARAETYTVAYHRKKNPDGTGKDDVWGIRYVDRFERRDDVWKIAHRVVAQEWRRVDPCRPVASATSARACGAPATATTPSTGS